MSQDVAGAPPGGAAAGAEPRHVLDARGLRCPLPIIRLAEMSRGLPPKTLVTVRWTDPAARHDVPAWARLRGHTVVATEPDVVDEPCAGDDAAGAGDRPGTEPVDAAWVTTVRLA